MQILDISCSEDHMVLEFLKAEKNRLGSLSAEVISACIDHGNVENKSENKIRAEWLGGIRGYWKNRFIFQGIGPMEWRYALLSKDELGPSLYINDPAWFPRKVEDMVWMMISWKKIHERIMELAVYMRDNWVEELPKPIILISKDTGEIRILEWHHRLTAFLLAVRLYGIAGSIEVIVGSTNTLKNWSFY